MLAKTIPPTLSLVTFLVTSFRNVFLACLAVESVRGSLLHDDFADGFFAAKIDTPMFSVFEKSGRRGQRRMSPTNTDRTSCYLGSRLICRRANPR